MRCGLLRAPLLSLSQSAVGPRLHALSLAAAASVPLPLRVATWLLPETSKAKRAPGATSDEVRSPVAGEPASTSPPAQPASPAPLASGPSADRDTPATDSSGAGQPISPADVLTPLPPLPPVTPAPPPIPQPNEQSRATNDAVAGALRSVADSAATDSQASKRRSPHWSLRFLQHITLAVSLGLLLLGTCLWLWGSKIYKLSPGSCCALMLGVWALAVYNAMVSAWSAETGMVQAGPAGLDDDVGGRAGLDLSTPGGAATFMALCGCIYGLAFVAWVFACSKPALYAAPVVGVVWGTLLGSIFHTAVLGWTLDTSDPVPFAFTMHMMLLLSILFCCALSVLLMRRYEHWGLIVATAGTGAWALVRASIMLIMLIEISSDLAPADGSELNSGWKWPNEWNLPLIDKLHPLRLSNYDAHASDPSYASSLPYSSLASSVTENDLRVNVQASYFFYILLISLLFGVGVSVQSIRRRRQCVPLYESVNNSRRSSVHHLLLGSGKKPSFNTLLPPGQPLGRISSFSEGGGHVRTGGYGSMGGTGAGAAAATLGAKVDGLYTYKYRPRSTSDEQRGSAAVTPVDQPQRLYAPRSTRSGSASPLRSALVNSNRSTPTKGNGSSTRGGPTSARRSTTPGQADWSRRTSFTLAVDVGRTNDTVLHVSRSPSAPALSALDADLLAVSTAGGVPPSQQLHGGIAGSLKRMRHAALAQKVVPGSARSKNKVSFVNEFGFAVHPQHTPSPPSDMDMLAQQKAALRPVGIDVSAGETGDGGVDERGVALPFRSPEAGSKSVPILSPAWSPYPLITPEAAEEYAERERYTQQQQQWSTQQT